jgi:hypothetical protein
LTSNINGAVPPKIVLLMGEYLIQTAQFLWVGSSLTKMEVLCLTSFVRTGYDVHLYCYDDLRVPAGVMKKDAAEVLSRDQIFRCRQHGFGGGSFAAFADKFRYHLLYRKGGWWFDMDFVSILMKPEPKDLMFASTWESEWGQCANNCAMYSFPGDDRIRWLRDKCDELITTRDVAFGETGPFLVQQLVREQGLEKNVASWWEFCPYPWRMVRRMAYTNNRSFLADKLRFARHLCWQVTQPNFRAGYIRKQTRAVHLHNEIWRNSGLQKDQIYHWGSLVGSLQRKYGITN